jgi:hypothetical protein
MKGGLHSTQSAQAGCTSSWRTEGWALCKGCEIVRERTAWWGFGENARIRGALDQAIQHRAKDRWSRDAGVARVASVQSGMICPSDCPNGPMLHGLSRIVGWWHHWHCISKRLETPRGFAMFDNNNLLNA